MMNWIMGTYYVLSIACMIFCLVKIWIEKRHWIAILLMPLLGFPVAGLYQGITLRHPKPLKPVVFTPDTSLDTCGILDHSEIPEK